jgi:hypothetical protein
VPGATAGTLTVKGATLSENGYEYRAVFTNEISNAMSAAATLTVSIKSEAPQVIANPVDKGVVAGEDAAFEAAASGLPTPTVQWQLSTNNGVAWSDLPGATSAVLNVEHTTVSESGYEYRAVFTNEVSIVTSTAATLNVKEEEHKVEEPKEEPKKEEPKAGKSKEAKSGEPIVTPTGSKEPLGWPEELLVSPLPVGSSSASGGGVLGGHTQASAPAPDPAGKSKGSRVTARPKPQGCSRASRRAAAAQTKRPSAKSRCGKPKPRPKGVRKRRR